MNCQKTFLSLIGLLYLQSSFVMANPQDSHSYYAKPKNFLRSYTWNSSDSAAKTNGDTLPLRSALLPKQDTEDSHYEEYMEEYLSYMQCINKADEAYAQELSECFQEGQSFIGCFRKKRLDTREERQECMNNYLSSPAVEWLMKEWGVKEEND